MTAEEMFQDLGYKRYKNKYAIFYEKKGFLDASIIFFLKRKSVKSYDCRDDYYQETKLPKEINLAELKAIIQQCKELRWLD